MNPTAPLMPPLSLLYGVVTRARLSLYRRGTFRTTKVDRPVISVGNITTGGSGKTPLVEWIARALSESGYRVCVLTRGYGRDNPNDRMLVSDGETVFSTPEEAGDEAFLQATNLVGNAAVISDANRVAAAREAIKHLRTDCFVLDDGFQHLRLARDLDIVTIDATNPWGGGRLLPEGHLREPLTGLARADCVVITRSDQVANTTQIEEVVHGLTSAPIFRAKATTTRVSPINLTSPALVEPVGAFCGVGNPQSFFTHLKRDGYSTVWQKALRDHQKYSQQLIDSLYNEAAQSGSRSLITTAKDAVKLSKLNLRLPTFRLDIELLIENEASFRELILSSINEQSD